MWFLMVPAVQKGVGTRPLQTVRPPLIFCKLCRVSCTDKPGLITGHSAHSAIDKTLFESSLRKKQKPKNKQLFVSFPGNAFEQAQQCNLNGVEPLSDFLFCQNGVIPPFGIFSVIPSPLLHPRAYPSGPARGDPQVHVRVTGVSLS